MPSCSRPTGSTGRTITTHYDFLLALSDELTGEGLEHHRSSENATDGNYFSEWDKTADGRDLLAHEFTHSWNGKYFRPADLWSPDFNSVPERDSLLWVYEGMTQYWGQVLTARAGLWTREQALDTLAYESAHDAKRGRAQLAPARGHHEQSDLRPPARPAVAQLAAWRGLLP